MSRKKQIPVAELLNPVADAINVFLRDGYIVDIQKKSGFSQPVISGLKRRSKRAEKISLSNLVKITNAVGYNVTEIKIEKV
jgi:hypothetical protein